MIIAFQDFRDEELFIPRNILSGEGADITIVSTKKGQAVGSYGGVVNVDTTLDEIGDYDAIVFIGGSGAFQYIDDNKCHKIIQDANDKGVVIGAICIAPIILAKAEILKGKKATVWSNNTDKTAIKIFKEEGVKYEDKAVVKDGNIVTANGPVAARQFAEALVQSLS